MTPSHLFSLPLFRSENPSHNQDHPIVLASDAFEELTGYDRSQIIGRNCRFLQGPGTASDSVQRIREGLNRGDGCNELLLNYRKFFRLRFISTFGFYRPYAR